MRSFIFNLLILSACTSQASLNRDKSMMMDSLWQKNATRDEVVKFLGDKFKDEKGGVFYSRANSVGVESGHFFNSSKKLLEQFIFLDESSFLIFIEKLSCDWKLSEKMESIGHTVYLVKKGECLSRDIYYEFKPGQNLYEIRWRK